MQSSSVPEHILTFGLYGSGKTHGWATIADVYREQQEPGTFWVIGTEPDSMGRLASKYPNFNDNVATKDVYGWREMTALTDKILDQVKAGDWIVIEGIDKAWQWVQELYDDLHGPSMNIDPDDPFSMELNQDEVQRDWTKINKVYRRWFNSIIRSPAHVYACSPQEALRLPDPKKSGGGWHDSKEVIEQYSHVGFRPAGQKELGHFFHSVLWLRHPSKGRWTVTTVDDHTREELDNEEFNNFVLDYLVKVAKWTL